MIFLTTYNGMTFTNAHESTKQLCTLKLKISNINKNGGKSVFVSIVSELSTDSKVSGDLLDPLYEEEALPEEVFPTTESKGWPP